MTLFAPTATVPTLFSDTCIFMTPKKEPGLKSGKHPRFDVVDALTYEDSLQDQTMLNGLLVEWLIRELSSLLSQLE